MDIGSSGGEDDDSDCLPLSIAAATATTSSNVRGIPCLTANRPKPKPSAIRRSLKPKSAEKLAATQTKPSICKRLATTHPTQPNHAAKKVNVCGAAGATTTTRRPHRRKSPAVASASVSSSSSNDDDDEASVSDDDDSGTTSSEEDDEGSDDEEEDEFQTSTPSRPHEAESVSKGATAVPVAVGVAISSKTTLALERLRAATGLVDPMSAPLGTSKKLSDAIFEVDSSEQIKFACSGDNVSLTETGMNELIQSVSNAAVLLAENAAKTQDVDVEVEAFRRVSHQIHGVWSATLPTIELLEASVREANESATRASRVAAELLGTHVTLANSIASSLESLLGR